MPATLCTSPISTPAAGPVFAPQVEQERGRPLVLVPVEMPPGHSSIWIATSNANLIVGPRAADLSKAWQSTNS